MFTTYNCQDILTNFIYHSRWVDLSFQMENDQKWWFWNHEQINEVCLFKIKNRIHQYRERKMYRRLSLNYTHLNSSYQLIHKYTIYKCMQVCIKHICSFHIHSFIHISYAGIKFIWLNLIFLINRTKSMQSSLMSFCV